MYFFQFFFLCLWTIDPVSLINSRWTYVCKNESCIRQKMNSTERLVTLNVCKLKCGTYRTLWPQPTGDIILGTEIVRFCPDDIYFSYEHTHLPDVIDLLENSIKIFKIQMNAKKNSNNICAPSVRVNVHLDFKLNDTSVTMETNENYTITSRFSQSILNITIKGENFFAVRNALQTLQQLVVYDEISYGFVTLRDIDIVDEPKYSYRGISLDTSRNYIPIKEIKNILDVMGLYKLNTFHWHLTDTNSFPFVSTAVPQMSEFGAYRSDYIYTAQNITDLNLYAKYRGIRIVPEIDAPAHTGYGWQWGPLENKGNMVLCVESTPWYQYCLQAPCGQLNPLNENMYEVLYKIYKELYELLDTDLFHIGGDEVKFECWNATDEILNYLHDNGFDTSDDTYFQLWGNFTLNAYQRLKQARNDTTASSRSPLALLWSSTLTSEKYIRNYTNENFIITFWNSIDDIQVLVDIVNNGRKVIIMNYDASYMDCGFGSWTDAGRNWCPPIKNWEIVYNNDILEKLSMQPIFNPNYHELIIGGAVALWCEQTDEKSVYYKLIPRIVAASEKWWSYPSQHSIAAADRYFYQNKLLYDNSVCHSGFDSTEWCIQNAASCA